MPMTFPSMATASSNGRALTISLSASEIVGGRRKADETPARAAATPSRVRSMVCYCGIRTRVVEVRLSYS